MSKARKNEIKYFYQIISDIKNNINTLIQELYENKNDLEKFSRSKLVVLKSKYPDLKKFDILKKNCCSVEINGNCSRTHIYIQK